ncbi:UNVERIFIED_CONTAM: hypothetical protein ABIC26_004616 [Paenibacillus sp. PvR008]
MKWVYKRISMILSGVFLFTSIGMFYSSGNAVAEQPLLKGKSRCINYRFCS